MSLQPRGHPHGGVAGRRAPEKKDLIGFASIFEEKRLRCGRFCGETAPLSPPPPPSGHASGIKRPGIATPQRSWDVVTADVAATLTLRYELFNTRSWPTFLQKHLKKKTPSIGLLNIGEEDPRHRSNQGN